MTIIYLVTQGEYSDYGIMGVFSSREKAQGFATLISNEGLVPAEVEEYELDIMPEFPKGMHLWRVILKPDLSLYNGPFSNGPSVESSEADDAEGWKPSLRFHEGAGVWMPGGYSLKVWARDKEHAIKIAREQAGMDQARRAGLT